MLKRESERLVEPWLGFSPNPPTCQFYMYCCGFIHCMKIPVIFFKMCSTHQPHWANKGKRMFQIYFCFSYLSQPNSWCVAQVSTHCSVIIILFTPGSPSLFPYFPMFMGGFQLQGNMCLLYCTLSLRMAREEVVSFVVTLSHGQALFFYVPVESF